MRVSNLPLCVGPTIRNAPKITARFRKYYESFPSQHPVVSNLTLTSSVRFRRDHAGGRDVTLRYTQKPQRTITSPPSEIAGMIDFVSKGPTRRSLSRRSSLAAWHRYIFLLLATHKRPTVRDIGKPHPMEESDIGGVRTTYVRACSVLRRRSARGGAS